MKPLLLQLIRSCGRYWCRIHGAEVASSALIHGFPRISRKSGARIILESGVTINAATWSNPHNDGRRTVLFAGPDATLRCDSNAGISSSRIISYQTITIGANTLIGAGCLICDSDMHETPLGTGTPVKTAPINIGNNVFIGANCTILQGVTIGDGSVIGASAVVTHSIPPGVLAAGNPATVIRQF